MAQTNHNLHVINSNGVRVDIPLFDTKEEALRKDEGSGKALAVYFDGKVLYAPTNDKLSEPDTAQLHFIDGDGNLRHVHQSIPSLELVTKAVFTSSFSDYELDFPNGGQIVVKSSNGNGGSSGTKSDWYTRGPDYTDLSIYTIGDGGSGGASGYGWQLNVDDKFELSVRSGGGGGGGAGSGQDRWGSDIYTSGGSGGVGSITTIDIGKSGVIKFSALCSRNNGASGTNHSGYYCGNGGNGGDCYPSPDPNDSNHKGSNGENGMTVTVSAKYESHTLYGGTGGTGGTGGPNQVTIVRSGFKYPFIVRTDNNSGSAYSVEFKRYECV